MKFVSKSSNLHIILRPGMQAQPITGTPAVPAISVRFQDGIADVKDEKLVEMMYAHPGFSSDFIAADDGTPDPYAYLRKDSEPAHVTTELKYGTPVSRSASPVKTNLPPEIKKLIQETAVSMAKDMVAEMMPDLMKAAVAGLQDSEKNVEKSTTNQEEEKEIKIPKAPKNK